MLERMWEYVVHGTTFLDKFFFCSGFVIGALVRSDETSDPFALLIGGLLIGFFSFGMWKLAKSGFRH
jgi:hypothetical protein